MQIDGFRIHLRGVSPNRPRPAARRAEGASKRGDSANAHSLAWLLLDPEPGEVASAAIRAAVADGSYWVPAFDLGRSLVEAHILVRP